MLTDDVLRQAVQAMRDGGTILYPTDTVWGLGCDATNPEAVERVFRIKRRSDSKSLVLLAENMDIVARYVKAIPNVAIDLVEVNDRPMTLIYPNAFHTEAPAEGEKAAMERHLLAYNAVAEDGSVGIRIPMMDFCVQLCHRLARPVVSTSANISGEPTPKRFEDIPQEIVSAVDFVVPKSLAKGSTGRASQIIKVELDGTVKIIRE